MSQTGYGIRNEEELVILRRPHRLIEKLLDEPVAASLKNTSFGFGHGARARMFTTINKLYVNVLVIVKPCSKYTQMMLK